jgi:hypothetical protein
MPGRPQITQSALDYIDRLRNGKDGLERHERGQPAEKLLCARLVAAALVEFQKIVVEEEHPDVPVVDQIKLGARCVRVGISRKERVIHGIESVLSPDDGTARTRGTKDPHLASTIIRMNARVLHMRVQSRLERQIEFRQLEGLLGGFFRLAGRKLCGQCKR